MLCKPEGTLEPYGTAGLRVYYKIITIMLQNYYKSITIMLLVNTLGKLKRPLKPANLTEVWLCGFITELLQKYYNNVTSKGIM